MANFQDFLRQLTRMQWSDYLDIILVAYLLYRLLPLFRSSGTMRVAKTVGALLIITWLTDALDLYTLNFLLDQLLAVGLQLFDQFNKHNSLYLQCIFFRGIQSLPLM